MEHPTPAFFEKNKAQLGQCFDTQIHAPIQVKTHKTFIKEEKLDNIYASH